MIKSKEIFPIGYVAKTHGIKGEINIHLDTEFNPEDFNFLIFEIDNIFVPFTIDSSRGNADTNRLVLLNGVDTVEEARQFVGKTCYVLKKELELHPDFNREEEDQMYLSDLVGYSLLDEKNKEVGSITGFNDDTQNVLLEVQLRDGRHIFVPYVDEWIIDLNQDEKTISVNLPNGLY